MNLLFTRVFLVSRRTVGSMRFVSVTKDINGRSLVEGEAQSVQWGSAPEDERETGSSDLPFKSYDVKLV